MKKTLTLLALAAMGIACGETLDFSASITFNKNNSTATGTAVVSGEAAETYATYATDLTVDSVTSERYIVTVGEGAPADSTDTTEYTTGNLYHQTTDAPATVLAPQVNIGTGTNAGDTADSPLSGRWTSTVTLSSTSGSVYELSQVAFNIILLNGSGVKQSGGTARDAQFTVTVTNDEGLVYYTGTTGSQTYDNGGTHSATIDLTAADGIDTTTIGDTFNLTITADRGTGTGNNIKGCFYGIDGLTVAGQVTPEPATATLSLLALAGLAARRRRK